MSATERLRALLDERGVEYEAERIDFSNYLTWGENDCYSYTEYPDGTVLRIWDCTPEQAIAATLGRGTCTVTHDFNCSNCGKQIGAVRNCEMYETCDGQQAWKSLDHKVCDVPNYCPNCGARVVEQ